MEGEDYWALGAGLLFMAALGKAAYPLIEKVVALLGSRTDGPIRAVPSAGLLAGAVAPAGSQRHNKALSRRDAPITAPGAGLQPELYVAVENDKIASTLWGEPKELRRPVKLRRYWFVGSSEHRYGASGLGVTAFSEDDAPALIRASLAPFFGRGTSTWREWTLEGLESADIVTDIDVRLLDQGRIVPTMGLVADRGVWWPKITKLHQEDWTAWDPPESPARPLLTVRADELASDPAGVRSRLCEILRAVSYFSLARTQQTAWLVVTYDAAVQKGGHRQYFSDFGVGVAADTRTAFSDLNAEKQRLIVNDAIQRHLGTPGETGFVDLPFGAPYKRPDYSDLDAAYFASRAEILQVVDDYIQSKAADFLLIQP